MCTMAIFCFLCFLGALHHPAPCGDVPKSASLCAVHNVEANFASGLFPTLSETMDCLSPGQVCQGFAVDVMIEKNEGSMDKLGNQTHSLVDTAPELEIDDSIILTHDGDSRVAGNISGGAYGGTWGINGWSRSPLTFPCSYDVCTADFIHYKTRVDTRHYDDRSTLATSKHDGVAGALELSHVVKSINTTLNGANHSASFPFGGTTTELFIDLPTTYDGIAHFCDLVSGSYNLFYELASASFDHFHDLVSTHYAQLQDFATDTRHYDHLAQTINEFLTEAASNVEHIRDVKSTHCAHFEDFAMRHYDQFSQTINEFLSEVESNMGHMRDVMVSFFLELRENRQTCRALLEWAVSAVFVGGVIFYIRSIFVERKLKSILRTSSNFVEPTPATRKRVHWNRTYSMKSIPSLSDYSREETFAMWRSKKEIDELEKRNIPEWFIERRKMKERAARKRPTTAIEDEMMQECIVALFGQKWIRWGPLSVGLVPSRGDYTTEEASATWHSLEEICEMAERNCAQVDEEHDKMWERAERKRPTSELEDEELRDCNFGLMLWKSSAQVLNDTEKRLERAMWKRPTSLTEDETMRDNNVALFLQGACSETPVCVPLPTSQPTATTGSPTVYSAPPPPRVIRQIRIPVSRTHPPRHPNTPVLQQIKKARTSTLLPVTRKRKSTATNDDTTRHTKRRRVQADAPLLEMELDTTVSHDSSRGDTNIDDEDDVLNGSAFAGDDEDDDVLFGVEFVPDEYGNVVDSDLQEGSDYYFDREEVPPTIVPSGVVVDEFVDDGGSDALFDEVDAEVVAEVPVEVEPFVEYPVADDPDGTMVEDTAEDQPVEDGVSDALPDIADDEVEVVAEVDEKVLPAVEPFDVVVDDPVEDGVPVAPPVDEDDADVEDGDESGGSVVNDGARVLPAGDWAFDARYPTTRLVRRSARRASCQESDEDGGSYVEEAVNASSTPPTTGPRRSARLASKPRVNYNC